MIVKEITRCIENSFGISELVMKMVENEENYLDWGEMMKNKQLDFILSDEQMNAFLEKIGHKTDDDGFLLDLSDERVHANDNDDIRYNEVAAILPGSEVIVKKNIAGFSQYTVRHKG